jgi:hypothetical protein
MNVYFIIYDYPARMIPVKELCRPFGALVLQNGDIDDHGF